jgi:hypothetical protein
MIERPIFIVGAPRSGTTLLRNILNRHPCLAICGETQFYHWIYARRHAFGDLSQLVHRRRVVDAYLSTVCAQRLGADLSILNDKLLRQAVSYPAFFAAILEWYAESQRKKRCGEKTPQHARLTETLCEWFPGARILHLVRDPRDVVASLQRKPWASHSAVRNAQVWLGLNQAALRSNHRPDYLQIKYEQLVTQPERDLQRICGFLGEDYSPAMLEADQTTKQNHTLRMHQQRVSQERVDKWREQLTADQVAQVEWVTEPLLETFGYRRTVAAVSTRIIFQGLSVAVLDTVRKQIVDFPSIWYYLAQPTQIAKEEYCRSRGSVAKRP